LATPAPAGGLFVSLTSSDTSKLTIQPANFIIPGGQTAANFTPQVTGIALGSVTITASAFGLPTATQTVVVGTSTAPLTMSFSPPTLAVAPGTTQNLPLTLSGAAPSALTINVSSSNTSAVTVPANVAIPMNATSVSVPVTGVAIGSATITASFTGIPSTTASITVSTSAAAIQLPANVMLAPGQTADFPVTLATPAGTGGVFVALLSSDTSKVTIVPANLLIPQGATTTSVTPKVTGVSLGSAAITASAFGLGSATQQVQVALTLSFPVGTQTVLKNTTPGITLNLSGPAPAGFTINLSSSNPAIASVPATVTFAQGTTSATVLVTGVALGGPVTITASAPGITGAAASVVVATGPSIILPVFDSLGEGTAEFPVSLSTPAPAGGLTVTLTSSDTTTFTITPSIFFPAGATTPSAPAQLTAAVKFPNLGDSVITATAAGYTTASLDIWMSDAITITVPHSWTVGLGDSGPLPFALPTPAPAGGLTVLLTSSDPTIIGVQSSVFIPAGKNLPDVPPLLTGLNFGSASIKLATPTYYFTWDNQPVQVVATLSFSPSPLTLSGSATGTLTLTLSGAAPAGGLTIALGSNNAAVASVPSSVTIPQGATSVTIPVTGSGTGQATITAVASVSGVPASTSTVIRQ